MKIIGTYLLFLLILSIIPYQIFAQEESFNDELYELEKKLPELSGKDRLNVLGDLIEKTPLNNHDKIRFLIDELEREAIEQENIKAQAFAKSELVELYVYQFDTDSVFIYADIAENFARKYKLHTRLFQIQQMVLQRYTFQGDFAKAIQKGEEIYNEAKAINNHYGLAMASAGIGNIYITMGIPDEALKFYKESLSLLKTAKDIPYDMNSHLTLNLYDVICVAYKSKSDLEKLELYTDSLQMKVDECVSSKITIELNRFRFAIEEFRIFLCLEREDTKNAWLHILSADSIYKIEPTPTLIFNLNSSKADYYLQLGEYHKSLIHLKEATDYLEEHKITDTQAAALYFEYATNLSTLGFHEEASPLYNKSLTLMTENYENNLYTQINQLRTIYDLDNIELQAEKDKLKLTLAHSRLTLFGSIILLLIAIVIIVIINMLLIRKKNIGLVQRIHDMDLLEEEIEKLRSIQLPAETLYTTDIFLKEDLLINKLKEFLKDNPVYTDPTINRKNLAEMLGTNENYLRVAIKEKLGYTFSEYINELRLNHAKKLLILPQEEYTIEDIAIESGFGTRSTMHRQFRSKYKITPDEYRKLINHIQ